MSASRFVYLFTVANHKIALTTNAITKQSYAFGQLQLNYFLDYINNYVNITSEFSILAFRRNNVS